MKLSGIFPILVQLIIQSLILLSFHPPLMASEELSQGECLECHGDEEIIRWGEEEVKESTIPVSQSVDHVPSIRSTVSPYIEEKGYSKSIHGDLSCVECHTDVESIPHKRFLYRARCGGCHEEEAAEFNSSIHVKGRSGMEEGYSPSCGDCHGAHYMLPVSSASSPVYFSNLSRTCGKCHGDPRVTKGGGIAVKKASILYDKSIHGRAVKEKGLIRSAECVDCHGGHRIMGSENVNSKIYRRNIPRTCGACHYGVYEKYRGSVHGIAARRGIPDAPVCTDCHGEHEIEPSSESSSYVAPLAVSTTTCPRCHDAERIVRKFGLETGRGRSYRDSYHGLALKLGAPTVANCASCHGAHGVYTSTDSRSTINKNNLQITCGKCHPGASAQFAAGSIHGEEKGPGEWVKKIVKDFYIYLIVLVIGFMVVHNFLDYLKKLKLLYREKIKKNEFVRMNRIERMEHLALLLSFFGLVFTGFALKFSWSLPILAVGLNEALRGFLHRGFALIMVGVCLHHLGYLLFTREGRDLFNDMLPRWKDATDLFGSLCFYLGIKQTRPRFSRFSYMEKMEYIALLWGSIIMIFTGFIMWFEVESMRVLPMWGVDLAGIIHFYEAILATLAIFVWHLYFVLINPDVAPMSFTWIDGKMTRHHMEIEHPLELERLDEKGDEQ